MGGNIPVIITERDCPFAGRLYAAYGTSGKPCRFLVDMDPSVAELCLKYGWWGSERPSDREIEYVMSMQRREHREIADLLKYTVH